MTQMEGGGTVVPGSIGSDRATQTLTELDEMSVGGGEELGGQDEVTMAVELGGWWRRRR